MIVKNIPNKKRMSINRLLGFREQRLGNFFCFLIININNKNEIQKNPQRINNIQNGEIWQLPVSKRNGPIFFKSVKNLGEQLTPIPDTKGLKNQEKGREKKINEAIKVTVLIKNLTEIPNIKKKMTIVNRIQIGPSKALVM